jgi:hypothetical protein
MNATPNNALQRTRVRPAGGRSPLSFETLCASLKRLGFVALATLWAAGVTGCGSTGMQSYCCPHAENRVRLCVRRELEHPEMLGLTTGIPAKVLFRDVDGRVLFEGKTNDVGIIDLQIDFRALRYGQRVEAFAVWQSTNLTVVQELRPGVQKYKMIATLGGAGPRAYLSDIDECE